MSIEIKRSAEVYIVDAIKEAIPTANVLPFTGFDDVEEIEPPFIVVGISEATRVLHDQPLYQVTGTVQVVRHILEGTVGDHVALAQSVVSAIEGMTPEEDEALTFHGIDIAGVRHAVDDDSKAQAEVIEFTAGFTAPTS